MALEKKAFTNLDQAAVTSLMDALWSGMHKANEPSRGHALTSGALHGAGTGLGHGIGSMATLSLLDNILKGNASPAVSTGLKMIAGPLGGMAGGRALPALAGAALDKIRPTRSSEGSERLASLKEGTMASIQELAKMALTSIKKANGPECNEGSYGSETDTTNSPDRNFLTKRRGWSGGPSIAELADPRGTAITRFNDDSGRGAGDVLLRGADAATGYGADLIGGTGADLLLQKLMPGLQGNSALLAHFLANRLGGNLANQMVPKIGAVKELAKLALEGSEPLSTQATSAPNVLKNRVDKALGVPTIPKTAKLAELADILGSGISFKSVTKKANFTQPLGTPVKSEFMHDPMDESMDMSATSQSGSMGASKANKKSNSSDKNKKASDEGTAMRSFMGSWNRSKDIHGKSEAYKNFMSRIGKYTSFE